VRRAESSGKSEEKKEEYKFKKTFGLGTGFEKRKHFQNRSEEG